MSHVQTLAIGMPVYNGARWLPAAIDSILAQGYRDFELIISDNASTDETESICRAYAERDARVHYHREPANIGVFRNYDRVFELSAATYFKWASCNDICLDGFFGKCVAVLERQPDVVLAYPRAVLVVAVHGKEECGEEYDDNLNLEQERPSERFEQYLNRERINNVMNGVMRSSALRETALNRSLPGSDISMIAELALRGKFVEIPDRLFVRRMTLGTTILSMDHDASKRSGYLAKPNNLQRLKLHSYRFVTVFRAPIPFSEKVRAWRYLLRRVAWLRHRVVQKVLKVVTGRR